MKRRTTLKTKAVEELFHTGNVTSRNDLQLHIGKINRNYDFSENPAANAPFTRRATNNESHHKRDEGRLIIKVHKRVAVARSACKGFVGRKRT